MNQSMHRNIYEQALSVFSNCHGGTGDLPHCELFSGKEFDAPIHFFNYTTLPPGCSIGDHPHQNDQEIYILLSGTGVMTFDGEEVPVSAGSVTVNRPYGTHGLKNTGEEDMRVLVIEVGCAE